MKPICFFAAVLAAAYSAVAAVKTLTWALPADWETNVEYASVALPSNAVPRLAINGPNFGYPSDPIGAPALPFLPVSIKVAEGSVYSNCTVEATWVPVETTLRPSIINEPHIVGEEPVYSPEDPQYFGAARYPAKPESVGGIETCAGESSIVAWVTPYRWNGQSGKLEKAASIKLTFTYDAPRAKLKLATSSADNYTGVMYIISPPNFTELWQAYVNYRETTHPDVEFHIVNTVTDIYNVSPYDGGRDDAQRIHKFLEAKYAIAKAANQKMYAILGAGCAKANEAYDRNTMIPLRMTVAYSRSYFPSDLYYSCMDRKDNKGEVWDYDNDGYFLGTSKSNSDPEWKIDWQPDIVALRFPVRTTVYLENVSKSASRSYTAQEQINGLVNKLKIYEGASGASRTFGGYFRYSVSYHRLFEDVSRGSTDDKVAGEHAFFDGIENMWTANHAAVFEDSERNVRHINHSYETAYRPLAGAVNNTQVYNNDLEINTHNSHGQEQTAAPFQAYDFFANNRIQFFMNYGNSCLTGKIDTGDVDEHGNLSFAEACILNPNGGAIVTLNNTREGYGAIPGYRELMSLAMQIGMIKGFYSLGDGSVYEAFLKGHQYAKSNAGFSGAGGCMAACYIEANTMGDPLAKLKPIASSAALDSTVNGFFATTGTLNGDTSVSGVSGVVNLNVNTAGGTVALGGGSQFKATGKVTVNGGGTLKWNAPGGVGRNGIAFTSPGRLVCEGNASRYFGARFSGLDEILVTGYNTTFDFDKTGATRDVSSLKFIGSDADGIAKCNYIRSREGGIFKSDMSIPVQNGTLVLQTTNIGGSGNASNTTTPIFTLTNAVLKIVENPHWANEMINRPVWMNGATISVAYQSFGFGAKVSGSNGMTLRVLDKTTNTISGNYDAEINGPFRVEVAQNAVIKINVPLTKSSYAGSLVKTGEGQLELRAANTFTGGIAINRGTVVFGKEALTSSACGTVTVEDGATLKIETLPLASVTKLTVKAGGKLILPGDASTASYQLVDPSVGSLDFAEGALVYNEHNLTTPLNGSATSDGYYMDTSSFLHWQDQDGTWSTDSSGSKWKKGGPEQVSYANGNSVQFPDHGKTAHDIAVSGTVQPGYITFNNAETAYNFTGSGSKISIENLYTVGNTTFQPDVSVGSKTVVTSGKTTYNNLTTASVSVAPKGKLQLTGTLTPATYIKQIVLKVASVVGDNSKSWLGVGTLYYGYQINGLRFYCDGALQTLPVGTTVSASGSFNGSTLSSTMTVKAASNGVVTQWDGDTALKNVFDDNASGGWGCASPAASSMIQKNASFTITINLGAPMRMFTKYGIAGGDTTVRSAKDWSIAVVENKSGGSYTVDTRTCGTAGNSWSTFDGIKYTGASSTSVVVSDGGTLFLDGTYNAPVVVGAGSVLAVINNKQLVANKGFALGGNVTLDVSEAGKFGWTPVLSGGDFAASDITRFALTSDEAAAKIDNKILYVATQGVKKGPYTREVAGDGWNWDSSDWKGNGTGFGCMWSEAITRMVDDVIITMNGSSTGTLGCAVNCNAIFLTNETDNAQTVLVNGSGTVSCKTLDFSGLKGEITWTPSIAGASVYVGSNTVHLLNGAGATLNVASNGYVSTAGTFVTYENDVDSIVRFAGTGARALTTSQIPSKGTVSFGNMTLSGGFQNTALTYLIELGDKLTISGSEGNNARMTSTFDIRGGEVVVNPQGSWWYGENGPTKFNLTGGTLTANATGTTIGNSGSGVVFGYQGEGTFPIEINVSGGSFIIPDSIANVWNPTTFNLTSNGLFHAKGIGSRNAITGNVNINESSVFEVGSVGMAAGAMTYNLYGGTIAGYENGAKVDASIELGGVGTLAAKADTTLTVNGAIKADNATLKIGRDGYAGTVKLAAIPTGITNYQVMAGTWDLGELRPTNGIPVSVLTGKIAALLTDEELREAANGGFKLIKTSLPDGAEIVDRVAVMTRNGVSVAATGRVQDGYIYLSVNYVYPLHAEVNVKGESEQRWADLDWHDAIGMPFKGEWDDVESAVLSNAFAGVAVVVTNAFDTALKVVNSGELVLSATTPSTYTLSSLDDSASTGKTTVDVTANNVTAGAETVIRHAGTGVLALAAGKCAALWNNLAWGGTISGFSGTAKIKYVGNGTLTSTPYNTSGEGYVSYAQKMEVENLAFENSLTRFFEDGFDASATRFVTGNQKNASGQVFYQTGGRITVTGTGSVGDATATSTSPILFSHWPNNVTYYLSGGELIATNGMDGSVYFGRDGVPKLYIGGGEGRAALRANGFVNDHRSDNNNKNGSVVELLPNGWLEIGRFGFALYQAAELRLSGGTFVAYEDAEIKAGTSKFTLTANTTSCLAVAAGKTLTVDKVPMGTGAILCQPGEGGTVLLKGGDWSNVTLGGTFTIRLTAGQRDSAVNTPLFKAADGLAVENVMLQNPDGTMASGKGIVLDGKFQYVADGAYVMPIKATISGPSDWAAIGWIDSSAEPRSVTADYLGAKGTSVVAELTVEGESEITDTATVGTLTVMGGGVVKIPSDFNISTLKGDGKVVADGYMPGWGGLTTSSWTGTVILTGTLPDNSNLGNLGNAGSTLEFAGTLSTYLNVTTTINSRFVLTGTLSSNNGNSGSVQAVFNGPFEGTGTLSFTGHGGMGNPDVYKILGDMSNFRGAIAIGDNKRSVTIGAHDPGNGYLYVTENKGATIAAGKQWSAASGCAINVDAGGVLNLEYRTANAAATGNVSVQSGGYINLLQTDPGQTEWLVASGTLTMSGGVMINGVPVGKDRYVVANGKIMLNANAVGASVSINVGGGGTGGVTGMLIADANYAGVIPVKGEHWNQDPLRTDGNAVDTTHGNLKEVLSDGSVVAGPMKVRLLAKNVWSAKGHSTPANGDAQMMFGYLDDGSCATTGAGAGFFVDDIPYTTYDVYVYMGSDADGASPAFVSINVTDGSGTKSQPSSWGKSASTHNTVTLKEGDNYVKFTGCSGSSLKVVGAVKSNSLRGGIAAIQIFNTGTRLNTLTWNGGATGGTWDRITANWTSASASTWNEVPDGVNTAKFNGDTSLTLGATVSPDVIDIRSNAVTSAETGFITTGDMVVAENMQIADVTAVSGEMWGGWITHDGPATPCFFTKAADNQSASVQMQLKDGELKCVKLTLTQDGNNIKARAGYAKYVGNTYAVGSVNFDTSASPKPSDSTVVTTDDGQGYGVKKLRLYNHSVGTLVVGGAEKFGKTFVVTNGVLTVAAGALGQDVTFAAGAKLNIVTTDITNEYVVTSGKVINGSHANILVNGVAIDAASWTLDLDRGKLVRVVQPGVPPFSYTISADASSPVSWTNQQWLASNMFYVRPEEWTTGTVSEVKLTVDGNVTNTLVANANMTITKMSVLNSGVVEVREEGGQWSLNVGTLDDSTSSGKTILGFSPTSVTAGANTILSSSIAGTLTVRAGSKATINGMAHSYAIASGGEVRFEDGAVTSKRVTADGAVVSYRDAAFDVGAAEYWKLKLYAGDRVTVNSAAFVNPVLVTGGELVLTNTSSQTKIWYGGRNESTKIHSVLSITGGKVTVLSTGVGTGTGDCGFLFGQTTYGPDPVLSIDGGAFDISCGRFTFWQRSIVNVANGGVLMAKGVNKQAGDASYLNVDAGGVLELGSLGLQKANNQTLNVAFSGGTLRAIDDATAAVPIALADGASTFSAANDKTLTVSGVLSGAGAFFAGEEGYAGTVRLAAQNTFTGDVGVRAGTLDIGGETLQGEVLVAEGATLAITREGAWGEFTITSGGTLNILGNVSLNGTVLGRNAWTVKDGKLVVYKPDGSLYWIGSVNAEWNTRDANWRDGEASVAWEDGHYEGNSASFTNSATITMSEAVSPRAVAVSDGQALTISGPTHFGRAFELTGALKLVPTSETVYDFEATGSGAITYEGGTITSGWRGNIPDGGLTMASGALSVTNGYFASGLNVGTANVFGTTSGALVFDLGADGEQAITGRSSEASRHYGIKVVSGELKFTDGGGDSAFRGRTVTADGTNAVINLATGDATGWSVGGTLIALSNGGKLLVSSRDTLKTPLLFNGGMLELAAGCSGTSGRGLDLYGNNSWAVTADSCVTYASEASNNDRKIALRNGDFTVAVEKDATMTLKAVLTRNNNYGGTEGRLVKTGAGTLALSADNTYCKGTRIENGTLALNHGATAGTGVIEMFGGVLEFAVGTMTNDIRVTDGVVNLTGAFPSEADEVVITTGTMTGEPQMRVNGTPLSPSEWQVVGNKLVRVVHIPVPHGEAVPLPDGYADKPVVFDVADAGGTLLVAAGRTLGSMAVSGGALTMKFSGTGVLAVSNGFSAASAVVLDATELDVVALAKCAVSGLPYSRWLVRTAERSETAEGREPLPAFAEVRLPEMPKHYSVTNEMVSGVGVRLVVTAPAEALFGAISVNFYRENSLGTGVSGFYPVDRDLWNSLTISGGASGTYDGATFTLSGNASSYRQAGVADPIYRDYIDDAQGGGVTKGFTVSGIPYDKYRIVVYFNSDDGTATKPFYPMVVNGVSYAGAYADGTPSATVSESTAVWGRNGLRNSPAEGNNALVTDVMTDKTAVLDFNNGSGRGAGRATPAAVQVVKVGEYVEPGKEFTATIDGDEYWEGINFSEIPWDGEAYEPGPNNTVTLTVRGDVDLTMDCELVLRELVVKGGEYDYLTFGDSGSPSLGEALANVSAFDFGGVDGVYSSCDFGARIVAFPRGYFALTTPHAGMLQDGYSYQGEGNAFTGSGFAGTKVSVSADSTLAGDFDVTDGGTVNFGYGTVASSASSFIGATKGAVEIGAYADVSVPHLRFLNSSDDTNHAVLNLYGTLNVDSVSANWNVWEERGSYKGILFGHWHGTGEYNVGIDPYDDTKCGRLIGEAAYLELVYTAEQQTLNVSGGTVRVRGMMANKTGGTINLTNGGRLELAEGFGPNCAAIVQNYGDGTVSAYSYNGSTGWTNMQAVSFNGTTIDPNGLTIGFAGGITCADELVINDTSAGKVGKVVLGSGISGQGASVRIDGGALELTTAATLGELTMATGTKLVLPAAVQALSVGAAVTLDDVTIDVLTVPAAAEGLVLVAAPSISGTPVAGANLAAAGWTFAVVDVGGGQVLKVVSARKGTMFLIR